MGGGGDDYTAQAAAAEAKKQAARDALNIQFGVAPTGGVAPTIGQFTTTTQGTSLGDGNFSPDTSTVDQSGFDSALSSFNNEASDAAANAAARDALYGTVRANAFDAGKTKLDDTESKASRNLRFTLFGQGLNGGSVDVDQNADLNRTYNQGLLDLGAKADATEADLRSSDEQTRLNLLQAIDSGLDQGSATSSALNQLKVNSDQASAAGQGLDLGDLFADTGLLYTKSNAARGLTDGQLQYNAIAPSLYAPRQPSNGKSGMISFGG